MRPSSHGRKTYPNSGQWGFLTVVKVVSSTNGGAGAHDGVTGIASMGRGVLVG